MLGIERQLQPSVQQNAADEFVLEYSPLISDPTLKPYQIEEYVQKFAIDHRILPPRIYTLNPIDLMQAVVRNLPGQALRIADTMLLKMEEDYANAKIDDKTYLFFRDSVQEQRRQILTTIQ